MVTFFIVAKIVLVLLAELNVNLPKYRVFEYLLLFFVVG